MNTNINFDNLLKQAQNMQSKMQSAQAELRKISVTGESGAAEIGSAVRVTMNGQHSVESIQLDYAPLNELKDAEGKKKFLEELIVGAFNDALQKIETISQQKLKDLTAQIQTKLNDNTEKN